MDAPNTPRDDAPERIWAVHHEICGSIMIGEWADTVRHLGGIEYVRADLAAPSAPAEVEDLVERLTAGVRMDGLHDDNNTELFDIDDADETMFEAATALTTLQATIASLTAELEAEKAKSGAQLETAAQVARDCYPDPQAEGDPGYIPKAIRALATEPGTTALAEMLDAETRACIAIVEAAPDDEVSIYGTTYIQDRLTARIDQRKGAGV